MATRKNWKKLIGTGVMATVTTMVGWVLCIIPGMIAAVLLALISPVVMMENLKGFAAFKRSKELVMRSIWTTIAGVLLMFLVPACLGGATGFVVAVTVKAFSARTEKVMIRNPDGSLTPAAAPQGSENTAKNGENEDDVDINFGTGNGLQINDKATGGDDMMKRVTEVARESSTAILMLPIQILVASLSAIIWALLYLKTRQAGGESMQDLMEKFEETDRPRKKWQERVRQRLIQSGRITSKST
jgi:hypothetical protein